MSKNICKVGISEYNINEPTPCDILKIPDNKRDTINFFNSLPEEIKNPTANQYFVKKGDILTSHNPNLKTQKVYIIGDDIMNTTNNITNSGASPNVFSGKLDEYNKQFYLIMEHFKNAFIEDAISYNSTKQRSPEFITIQSRLDLNNANLFKFSNKLDKDQNELLKRLDIKGKQLNQLRIKNDNLKTKLKNHSNDNDVAILQSKDKQFTYNLNNIIMFNYLFGIILCVYILKNL